MIQVITNESYENEVVVDDGDAVVVDDDYIQMHDGQMMRMMILVVNYDYNFHHVQYDHEDKHHHKDGHRIHRPAHVMHGEHFV